MKTCIVAALALVAAGAFADTPNLAYDIWPKGKIPLAKENPKPEGVEPMRDDVMRIANVSVPQVVVTPVPNAEHPTPAIVICPGGGYGILAWNHEGVEVAQWLKDQGIAGVILKYRVPDQRDGALADAQRAIRWTRANAAKFNIDPEKVDEKSCRPDFQMPIYPWDLIKRKDKDNVWKGHEGMDIRLDEYPVDADTPRAFIVQSEDDFCQIETSLAYYAALKKAGVGAELHAFEKGGHGGHGYGVRRLGFPTDAWPALAEEWLEQFK